jgi:pimeloyl-ACP methyl ester carboxylesterase
MASDARFCTAPDGTRIAYAVHGSGPPLVRTSTWLTHLEFDWQSPVWRHWLDELGDGNTLVRYDERGCGLSDREVEDLSLEARVADLETVIKAAALDRFALLGMSQGGPPRSCTPPATWSA